MVEIEISIAILFLLLIILAFKKENLTQRGGYRDPYAWIRPMLIVDFFRNFWFTR